MARTVESVAAGHDLRKDFIRGSARIIIADMTTPFPTQLADVIRLVTTSQAEVQSLAITGTPTGGTFTLSFKGYVTASIVYNAAAAAVQAALEAITTIGTGGVLASGGPLPGTPVVLTFQNQLGGQSLPLITIATPAFTGGTTPTAAVTRTTAGFGQYDAQAAWAAGDMGPTKGGITIGRNNSEETFSVDQIQADFLALPTAWEVTIATQISRADIDSMQYIWEGGTITVNGSNGERFLPIGAPPVYRMKRCTVVFQRQSFDGGVTVGLIRAYCMRITTRSAAETSLAHAPTGDQATMAFTWRALPDTNIQDPWARFGGVLDQV